MKIILLASNPKLYSNMRLIEAAKKRNHEIEFINIGGCYIKVASNNSEIFFNRGQKLENIDCVIPRIKPSITNYGTAILRQFEIMGVDCLNNADSILKSRDKLCTLQILSMQGFNVPITSFANSFYETKHIIDLVGGSPLVIKLLQGTKGVGVVMAENNKAAENVINSFRSLKAEILVQHYVKECKGQDIRCFVVGGEVVASMQRQAQEGEFRANIHLGAKAYNVEISDEERQIAIKAAKLINLEVAGVDLVRSDDGPKILEINSSPGLEGIESVSGMDIAEKIIMYIENKFGSKKINK